MNTLTVRIPAKLKRRLRKLCARQDRPVNDFVGDSLRRYIALEDLRAVRGELRLFAEARNLLTEDDVYWSVT